MSAPDVDLLAAVRAHLGAASHLDGELAAFHLAHARLAFDRAREELRSLEYALIARERAMVAHATAPVQQELPAAASPDAPSTDVAKRKPRHRNERAADVLGDPNAPADGGQS